MKHMRYMVVCSFMLAASASSMAQTVTAPAAEVTVSEAVQRALDVQPAMVEAEGTQRIAKAGDRSAWAAFLPTLTTSASAARNSTPRIDTNTGLPIPPGYVYTLGVSANLELFDGFRRYAQLKSA